MNNDQMNDLFETLSQTVNRDGLGETLEQLANVMRSFAREVQASGKAGQYYLLTASKLDAVNLDILRLARKTFCNSSSN